MKQNILFSAWLKLILFGLSTLTEVLIFSSTLLWAASTCSGHCSLISPGEDALCPRSPFDTAPWGAGSPASVVFSGWTTTPHHIAQRRMETAGEPSPQCTRMWGRQIPTTGYFRKTRLWMGRCLGNCTVKFICSYVQRKWCVICYISSSARGAFSTYTGSCLGWTCAADTNCQWSEAMLVCCCN